MTIKDELHRLVDTIDGEEVRELLDYVRWLAAESETLTDVDETAGVVGMAHIGPRGAVYRRS